MPSILSRRTLLALAGLALAACASAPPAPPVAAPAPGGDELRVLVFRGGRAPGLGHNHVLLAGDLRVSWPGPVLRFRLDALLPDPPALREQLGPAFASRLDEAAVAATRANLLKALDAAAHPEVVVTGLQLVGEGAQRAAEVEVRLHGSTRRQWVAVTLEAGRVRGQAVIRQSDYGIQPFSVLGGLLAVQDELVVQFDLAVPASP